MGTSGFRISVRLTPVAGPAFLGRTEVRLPVSNAVAFKARWPQSLRKGETA